MKNTSRRERSWDTVEWVLDGGHLMLLGAVEGLHVYSEGLLREILLLIHCFFHYIAIMGKFAMSGLWP